MKIVIYIIIITLLAGCASTPKKEGPVKYLDDAKMYYKFRDFNQSINMARQVLNNNYSDQEKEEALYIINEAAEEIVIELKRDLYIKDEEWFEKKIKSIKEEMGIDIEIKKVGYEYFIYYDKAAFYELKSMNPKSKFVRNIEDKILAREARFVTDPAYRYREILAVIEKYWETYEKRQKALYAPSILLRLADLYLYLYENGANVKQEIGLSDGTINEYYQKARDMYTKIKKQYPNSEEAQSLGYVIDSVKLRDIPSTKAKVVKKIPAGTLVRIVERSEKRESISNMYDYWFRVKLIDGLEGWIYGFYIRTSFLK
ncbi:MAG: SH3 domain-containing protein [Spirochaetes bacterium]|nr:SH3 domain-containing protein [Spirochaetota bacterium]